MWLDLCLGEELSGSEAELGHFVIGDLAARVDDEGQAAHAGLLAEPFDEGEAVAIGQGEVEDEQIRPAGEAAPDSLLAGRGVVDVHIGLAEAGDDDAGEIFVIFDEEDLGGTVAGAEDTAEFGEEEIFVEGLLDPALGVAGKLGTESGGEDAEDHDGNVGGDGGVA